MTFMSELKRVSALLLCDMFGHQIVVGKWVRSSNTVATHKRSHTCVRCDYEETENGYFDANHKVECTACSGRGFIRVQCGFFMIEQKCSKCNGSKQIVYDPCDL